MTFTDHNGQVTGYLSFDIFGKPKGGDGLMLSPSGRLMHASSEVSTRRGFTDHEHLDEVELIHMNGRVYDYNVGRFLSVDPFIQEPGNSQSMNPYSYIMNNPLAGTDPSGYRWVGQGGTRLKSMGNLQVSAVATTTRGSTKEVTTVIENVNFKDNAAVKTAMAQGTRDTGGALKALDIGNQGKLSIVGVGNSAGGFNFNNLTSYAQSAFDDLQTSIADTWSQLDGVDKRKLLEESIYLGLNSLGTVAGGIMLVLPEPTTATKWLGGALFTKSTTGAVLNIANIREAWSGSEEYMPSSLASFITQDASNEAKAVANIVDLAIDYASGRAAANAVIKHITVTGKYGTSEHLTEPLTVQKFMGSTAEKAAIGLTLGQSSIIMLESAKSIDRSLQ